MDVTGVLQRRDIESDDLVGDVRPGGGHLFGGPDVALGDLGEATVRSGGPHRRLDEPVVGEAVEHHVDAGAVGVGQDLVGEIRAAGVVDVLDAHLAQRGALEGARGREHGGATLLRHLDRRQADTAAGGVDEDAFPRLDLRPVERQPHRERSGRNGGRRNRAQPVGYRSQQLCGHVEAAGEGALHEAVDPLTDLQAAHAGPDLGDDAGEIAADRAGVAGVEAQDVEHVTEVQPRGLDPDLHVAVGRRCHLHLGQPQVVDRAALGGRQHVVTGPRHRQMTAACPRQQPRGQQLALPKRALGLRHGVAQQPGQRRHRLRRPVDVDQPAAQRRLLVDGGAAQSPQRGLHRVDGLAGLAGDPALGDDPQPVGQRDRCAPGAALHRVHGAEQVTDLGLQPRCDVVGVRVLGGRRGAPDDAGERQAAVPRLGENLTQRGRVGPPVERDAAGHGRRQFVEPGDQPGAGGLVLARLRWRDLMPAQRVEQAGGVPAEAAQQRLARCAFDRELADPAQQAAVAVDEIEVEDLGFAVHLRRVPPGAAVEPARHLLPQRDLPVPQRQEQVVDALLGGQQRRERRERDAGAQVHQHRVHRFGAELFGELRTDQDVTDRFAVAEPQRLQRTRPGRSPRQLQICERLEQLLRPHAGAPLDRVVDRLGLLGGLLVVEPGGHRAFGVQRPVGVALTVGPAVHLERPAAGLLRVQRQLDLARALLRQDDRLVEEDVLHACGGADRGQGHGGIGRTRDDDGAVDDVVTEPGLRPDRQPAGVHGVAGREILGAAQDPGGGRTAALHRDTGRSGPEATALERVGRQLDAATGTAVDRREIRTVATDVRGGQRVGDLTAVGDTFAQRDHGPRCGHVLGPHLDRGPGQHRLRPDLHQDRAPQRRHGAHTLGELHRLARMPAPVTGIDRGLGGEHGAGAVAHQRKCGRGERHPRGVGLELVEYRVQQLGVERVTGFQPGAADAVGAEPGDDLLQVLAGAREHGVGPVVGPDRHPRELGGGCLDTVGVGEHRHHPPTRGQAAEHPAAFGHQPHPVFEAEHPGHAGRRVLAHAVTEDDVRFDAPRLPQPGQAHLDGEQRRLCERRVPQPFSGLTAGLTVGGEQHLQQRIGKQVGDRLRAAGHRVGEDRFGVEQFPGHPRVLAALSGEQPCRRGTVGVLAAHHPGAQPILGQVGQRRPGTVDRVHHQRGAVLEMRPPRSGRQAHVAQIGIRVGAQPAVVALRQGHQRFRRACRQR